MEKRAVDIEKIKEREEIILVIRNFCKRMEKRMLQKLEEGKKGWNDINEDKEEKYSEMFLWQHIHRISEGDYRECIDAANYLMIIDNLYNKDKDKDKDNKI